MKADQHTNLNITILALHAELEACIATYPDDLRKDYEESKAEFRIDEDEFEDKTSGLKSPSPKELAPMHRLMFASAFTASASSLLNKDIPNTPIESTTILLDALTEAGLPAREFLRCYGKYGNHFTWKLMKLTGRISENSNQLAPDLVKGA